MRNLCPWLAMVATIVAFAPNAIGAEPAVGAASPFALRDGDRVVFVGDTLLERDQRYGYLETELTAANPKLRLAFRNVAWSGDNAAGLSRAYFDPPAEGNRRLVEQVQSLRPTVLVVGFGMAESFGGENNIPAFTANLGKLLGVVQPDTRLIFVTPIPQVKPRPFLPDPAPHNAILQSYSTAIRSMAAGRNAALADMFEAMERPLEADPQGLSDNGIHLTERGHQVWASAFRKQLNAKSESIRIAIGGDGAFEEPFGTRLSEVAASPNKIQFAATDARLPSPLPRGHPPALEDPMTTTIWLKATKLAAGKYTLRIDGKEIVTASAEDWAKGIELLRTPQHEQVESLRRVINRKNLLYFQRYRPQNITYLLGFRRYEQGQNAKEIDQLDQFVAEAEAEIHKLKLPVARRYELTRSTK